MAKPASESGTGRYPRNKERPPVQPLVQSRRKKILILLCLALATCAVYRHGLQNGFVNYDDDLYVTENLQVKAGLTLDGVWYAFTTLHTGNWHPLTWLSLELDCQLFGLNPWGFHLTNLLLHVASTLLLFAIFERWTGAVWRSALVAALFALHPLRVESVAWVAERKDVLSALFWMLTLAAYAGYVEKPGIWRYGLVGLVFVAGLLAKPMLVTLPFVLLLLDSWPLARLRLGQAATQENKRDLPPVSLKYLVLEKTPLFALAVVSGVMTLTAQCQGWKTNRLEALPLRLENALVSCAEYVGKIAWPQGLIPLYPFPRGYYPFWQLAVSMLVLVGISVLVIRWRKRRPYLPVGWLWFLGTIFPVLGIIPAVGIHAMADRYTYLPSIGIFLMASWGLADLVEHTRFLVPAILLTGGALLLVIAHTWIQVTYWHDSAALWEHTLQVSPDNALAHTNLGVALQSDGHLEEAIRHYTAALEVDPEYANAQNNLGLALDRLGKRHEAISHLRAAVRSAPGVAEHHLNLAPMLVENRNWDEAIEHLYAALEIEPDNPELYFHLGRAYSRQERWGKAAECLREAVRLQPNVAHNRSTLAYILHKQGQTEAAQDEYQEAWRLDPHWAETATRSVWIFATHPEPLERNGPHALELALMICDATGNQKPEFLDALAAAYAEVGNFDDAVVTARQAIERSSQNAGLAAQIQARLRLYEGHQPFRSQIRAAPTNLSR